MMVYRQPETEERRGFDEEDEKSRWDQNLEAGDECMCSASCASVGGDSPASNAGRHCRHHASLKKGFARGEEPSLKRRGRWAEKSSFKSVNRRFLCSSGQSL